MRLWLNFSMIFSIINSYLQLASLWPRTSCQEESQNILFVHQSIFQSKFQFFQRPSTSNPVKRKYSIHSSDHSFWNAIFTTQLENSFNLLKTSFASRMQWSTEWGLSSFYFLFVNLSFAKRKTVTEMKIVSIYVQKISMEGAQSSVRKGVVQFKRFPEDHTLLLKKKNVPLMQIADVPKT